MLVVRCQKSHTKVTFTILRYFYMRETFVPKPSLVFVRYTQ